MYSLPIRRGTEGRCRPPKCSFNSIWNFTSKSIIFLIQTTKKPKKVFVAGRDREEIYRLVISSWEQKKERLR